MFGTGNSEEISHKWLCTCLPLLINVNFHARINKFISEGLMQVSRCCGIPDHSSRNSEVKCQFATPVTLPLLLSRFDKCHEMCARYPLSKNLCYQQKVDKSSFKSLKTCDAPIPLTLPNLFALRQKCAIYPPCKIFDPRKRRQKFTIFGE